MNRTIERIELNVPPVSKDAIASCRKLSEDRTLCHELRQLAEVLVQTAEKLNIFMGGFEHGCAIITEEISERSVNDFTP